MKKIIITNPKFIVERDGNDYVLKFRDGNIYKPIEFNNAQFSGKKNMVISQPNFSIIDDKLYVNVNGHDIKIGEVGDSYTLASKLTRNTIVEPNLDVVITSNGGMSIVTEIGGKNITINGGGPEPVYTNRIYYTVVTGGYKPESTWITENCSDNVFDESTGEGYLVLNDGVTELQGWYDEDNDISHTIFKDIDWNDEDGDENIATVVIPTQITSIGYETFYYYYELTSVTIPNSVTSIGYSAFEDCSGLTSVIIPDSVETIGNNAFNGCTGLTSVTIPNSITSIGDGVFYDCSGLTSVTIPNSVTSIGNAFNNCTSLTSVTCFATTPPTLDISAFSGINTTTCGVPSASISAYESSSWYNNPFTTFVAADV